MNEAGAGETLKPGYIVDGGEPTEHAELKIRITEITLEDKLRKLCDSAELPEYIKDAFNPDNAPLFYAGFPDDDEEYREQMIRERHEVLAELAERTHGIYVQKTFFTGENANQKPAKVFEGDLRSLIDHRLSLLREEVDDNHFIGDSVYTVLPRAQFLYYATADTVWDPESFGIVLSDKDVVTLYGDTPPEKIAFDDLATKYVEEREIDLSNETLDQRFATFEGLLEVDLSLAVLRELRTFAVMGSGNHKKALILAERHKELLLSCDIPGKLELLRELGKRFQISARGATGAQKAALETLNNHSDAIATRTDEFLHFFHNVYGQLGYTMPRQIEADETTAPRLEIDVRTASSVATTAVVELAPEEPSATPEVIEEIGALREELNERIENAAQPWRLSRKKLKESALDRLQGVLRTGAQVDGHAEGIGDWDRLAPLTADRAAMVLGTLVRVEELGRGRNGRELVQRALTEAAEEYQTLIAASEILGKYAEDERHDGYIRPNRPYNPSDDLQLVADNWHVYGRLLQEMTPTHFAGNVWQHLPEPRPNSRYAQLMREYNSYNHNAASIPVNN
jgi:hypothetical protein